MHGSTPPQVVAGIAAHIDPQVPQSPGQLEQVSDAAQTRFPHGSGSGQAPQSAGQEAHVSPASHTPFVQEGAQLPQSPGHDEHVSPASQTPFPHGTPLPHWPKREPKQRGSAAQNWLGTHTNHSGSHSEEGPCPQQSAVPPHGGPDGGRTPDQDHGHGEP